MGDKPILAAIRALLTFRDDCSIAEIAKIAGASQRQVLAVVNANGHAVWRNRKTGRITKVDPQAILRKRLFEGPDFYRIEAYGAWSHEGDQIVFNGRDELRARLARQQITGALGDSWNIDVIHDTPENRAAVEAEGLRPWADAVIDDRLWVEPDGGESRT